ncbi:universal stress protein [Halobaculum rubrum]|uniref:universal stress protein n=1 Tax=Halobaculum rubrum TaxID=2872158 RepID=UPI001CA387B6|nr:universal stress protein [Halobaculum rubrum]QZX99157.1 universal stress protein [Halobaculum rubrum]
MRAVFATDLSEASRAAFRSRTCLHCLDAIGVSEVHLFTVVPDNVSGSLPGMDAASDASEALEPQRETFEAAGFDVETHVARGAPYRRINGLAERLPADLTVVGSRGQSPLRNRLIGDTVRNVARTSVVPLLVERIDDGSDTAADADATLTQEHLFREILYVTDFSDNAERAFEFLPRLRRAADRVTLLHVLERERTDRGESFAVARERLAERAADLDRRMDVETDIAVRSGEAVEGILAEERRIDPTLTLLGARGTSRLRRLLLGNVSESVIARGTSNVLLVPPASVPPR